MFAFVKWVLRAGMPSVSRAAFLVAAQTACGMGSGSRFQTAPSARVRAPRKTKSDVPILYRSGIRRSDGHQQEMSRQGRSQEFGPEPTCAARLI